MKLFLKNLLFTFLVPGTVAVYIPLFGFSHGPAEWSLTAMLGGFSLFIGVLIYTLCVWDFATAGQGTPAPIDPPKALVVRGLFKYARNPMYIGVLCVVFGWALAFWSLNIVIYGASVAFIFHLVVVLYEEPALASKFGDSYKQYCSEVKRWMLL